MPRHERDDSELGARTASAFAAFGGVREARGAGTDLLETCHRNGAPEAVSHGSSSATAANVGRGVAHPAGRPRRARCIPHEDHEMPYGCSLARAMRDGDEAGAEIHDEGGLQDFFRRPFVVRGHDGSANEAGLLAEVEGGRETAQATMKGSGLGRHQVRAPLSMIPVEPWKARAWGSRKRVCVRSSGMRKFTPSFGNRLQKIPPFF